MHTDVSEPAVETHDFFGTQTYRHGRIDGQWLFSRAPIAAHNPYTNCLLRDARNLRNHGDNECTDGAVSSGGEKIDHGLAGAAVAYRRHVIAPRNGDRPAIGK